MFGDMVVNLPIEMQTQIAVVRGQLTTAKRVVASALAEIEKLEKQITPTA